MVTVSENWRLWGNAGTMYIEFRWDGSHPLQDSGAARDVTAKYNLGH